MQVNNVDERLGINVECNDFGFVGMMEEAEIKKLGIIYPFIGAQLDMMDDVQDEDEDANKEVLQDVFATWC